MEAIRLGTEALSLDEKLHGNKTLSYAASLNNLALYKSNFGNYTEAISLVSEALNIQKELT